MQVFTNLFIHSFILHLSNRPPYPQPISSPHKILHPPLTVTSSHCQSLHKFPFISPLISLSNHPSYLSIDRSPIPPYNCPYKLHSTFHLLIPPTSTNHSIHPSIHLSTLYAHFFIPPLARPSTLNAYQFYSLINRFFRPFIYPSHKLTLS